MINSFNGEYRFLSNYYSCKVRYGSIIFSSVENAFQAAKSLDTRDREHIKTLSPGGAKRYGRNVKLRYHWDNVKIGIMLSLIKRKFSDKKLAKKLIDTGDQELIEGNTWHDNYWGVCYCDRCSTIRKTKKFGKNVLGKILMDVREQLINPDVVEEDEEDEEQTS
jgi:hypothetical protein